MRKTICILLVCISFCFTVCADSVQDVLNDTAAYLTAYVERPAVGSAGGEWLVLGLARSGVPAPDGYFEGYYENVCAYVREKGGVLHERKYTEYARVVLALTAIGKNPADVCGYNLLAYLGDYERVTWQGINGPVFALLALDSGHYEVPVCTTAKIQATRQMYIDYILKNQAEDGGFPLAAGGGSDVDVTAMAIQALANYRQDADVEAAIDKALGFLSASQNERGGFASWDGENSESSAQVLAALAALDLSVQDARFVKNGTSVLDHLLSYYSKGNGFLHVAGDSSANLMSTEQAFYALVAYNRQVQQQHALYNMEDAITIAGSPSGTAEQIPVSSAGRTFADIQGSSCQREIEALAARDIINGKAENLFEPESTMTRAEFAAITVRALGLPLSADRVFDDVLEDDWHFGYVAAAWQAGIVNGVSETAFHPDGTVTRQEAAVMTARAAELCGMHTALDSAAVRDLLAQFDDYQTVAGWAQDALAFCYGKGILSQDALLIEPEQPVRRDEIACMLYNLLHAAGLIQE